jgi:hypothetical protein
MDFALLHFWPIKDKQAVSRLLGVAEGSARERYRYLTKKPGGGPG